MLGLKVQRVSKGMTQEELANELKVSTATIIHWERDITTPTPKMLKTLAEYFGCLVKELF